MKVINFYGSRVFFIDSNNRRSMRGYNSICLTTYNGRAISLNIPLKYLYIIMILRSNIDVSSIRRFVEGVG